MARGSTLFADFRQFWALSLIFTVSLWGQQSQESSSSRGSEVFSDADLVVYLQRSIVEDEQRLERLADSAQELSELFDTISDNARKSLSEEAKAKDAAAPDAVGEASSSESNRIDDPGLRTRLEIILQRRQASERQERVVRQKLDQERELLELVLIGEEPPVLKSEKREESIRSQGEDRNDSKSTSGTSPIDLLIPGAATQSEPQGEDTASEEKPGGIYSIEEVKARSVLARRLDEASGLGHQLAMVDRLIALEEADHSLAVLLEQSSGRGQELVEEAIPQSERELEGLGEDSSERRNDLEAEIKNLKELQERVVEVRQVDEALAQSLSNRLKALALFRGPLLNRVSDAEMAVEKARIRLTLVQSPLAPHNIKKWFVSSAPKLVVIVSIFVLLWVAVQGLARRLFVRTVRKSGYGSEAERMERVDTIVRVFKNGATILIVGLGLIAVLPEFGVDLTVLLGGAAVISLAVAFGAQALVKD